MSSAVDPYADALTVPPPESRPPKTRTRTGLSLFDPLILRQSCSQALINLEPRHIISNPVMFAVEMGGLLTTVTFLLHPTIFVGSISAWL